MDTPASPDPAKRTKTLAVLAVLLVVLAAVSYNTFKPQPPEPKKVPLTELLKQAQAGKLAKASLDDESRTVTATPKSAGKDPEADELITSGYPYPYADELVTKLSSAKVKVTAAPAPPAPSTFATFFTSLVPVFLIMGFLAFFLMKRGGLGPNTSLRKGSPVEVPTTRFSDVAGQSEAVEDLSELTGFLHHPERYIAAGAKLPTGVLLVGPPGTGKTLLARAVAGEAGVPFFALSGSDFVETYVGVGASRVRSVFEKARKHQKAIIFIDELDAVGRARSAAPQGGAEERESTLNQLLVEMDGFHTSGILILAATNRPDVLDPALLRPGRFDRQVVVPAPDRRGRERIIELYASGKSLAPDVDFEDLARRTPGLTGADLANLVNEAAIVAGSADRTVIAACDFDEALQTIAMGRARHSAQPTVRDREITAWHEAGHAVTALASELIPDPVQVTIVPRGTSGGATWSGGRDETFETASELRASLVHLLGGRAAEEVLLGGDHTPGAVDDFRQATSTATKMVCEWGMSPLGIVRLDPARLDPDMSSRVHQEISAVLDSALVDARDLLADHRDLLAAVARELLAEETLNRSDLHRIVEAIEPDGLPQDVDLDATILPAERPDSNLSNT
jgi:cell division protease FtsH